MEQYIKCRPTPTNEYLGNPHKGCCTFQHFNGDPLFPGTSWEEEGPTEFSSPVESSEVGVLSNCSRGYVAGYLPSTVAYCRWFWDLLEPEEGHYDFSVIEKALEAASQRSQTLAVRLMAYGAKGQPQVPEWYSAKYPCEVTTHKGAELHLPIHDSVEYFEKWGGLIKAFADKFDDDPRLESIDIAYIGPWGEGAGECSVQQCARFARLWKDSFRNTPCLSLIAGVQFKENIQRGSGWRCDCFGDLQRAHDNSVPNHLAWNHMCDCYPEAICKSGARDAWRNAPVHFETCWVPMHWYNNGFDIDFIIAQGLKYHGTYFMPKYTCLPDAWLEKLSNFCRKLGYRFIFRQSKVDATITRAKTMHFDAWIENVGVAPIYRRYDFALRFSQGDDQEVVVLKNIDIRDWMPGDTWLDEEVEVPGWLKPGVCDVAAGIVDAARNPTVKFAVKEQYKDGWVPLARVLVA